jgi:peptidoglycan-associated lipoprotein
MRAIATLTTIVSGAVLLAACSSTPTKVAETPAPSAPAAKPVQDTRAVNTVVAPAVDPLNDPNNILSKRSVYFDFDSYVVKSEYSSLEQAHAKYLAANKGRKVLIQGNTDERGGSEYNLALGQKRAEAVRKAMALLGTPDSQMEAVSLGKEKPKAAGHDEAAWAENRRADIVYAPK